MYLVNAIVGLVYLCVKCKAKINSNMQNAGDVNMRVMHMRRCGSVPLVSEIRQRSVSRRCLIEGLVNLRSIHNVESRLCRCW